FDRDLIRGGHYGQRSCEPHTGRTHGCTDPSLRREESPCQPGAVHTWHEASFRCSAKARQLLDVKRTFAEASRGNYLSPGFQFLCLQWLKSSKRCGRRGGSPPISRRGHIGVREPTTTSDALIPKPPEHVSQFWDRCSLFTELLIPIWPVHADQKPRTRPVRAKFPHRIRGRIAETDRTTGHRSVQHSAPVRPSARVLPLR